MDLTREQLAKRSGVAAETIRDFERGQSDPKQSTILRLRHTLEKLGVRFLDQTPTEGPGLRLAIEKLRGEVEEHEKEIERLTRETERLSSRGHKVARGERRAKRKA
jgi:transcriptional regulator with XRE-family HTH domain